MYCKQQIRQLQEILRSISQEIPMINAKTAHFKKTLGKRLFWGGSVMDDRYFKASYFETSDPQTRHTF